MWFLSPSGWPTSATDGSLFAQALFDRGWQVMDASEVQAAVDAYNAGQVLVPTPPDYVDDDELAAAIGGIAAVPDATATVKGKVRLTGDLGGTADAPTVPGLAGKVDTSTFTAGLANKVDLSAFTAGLGTKQDKGTLGADVAADPAVRAAFGPRATVARLPAVAYAAHRGGSQVAPEETIEAFRLAANLGTDIIDLDVNGTADFTPVVIHDADIARTTTGAGNIQTDHTGASAAQLVVDAGTWHAPGWPNNLTVVTLDQVLSEFGGKKVLSIEVKDPRAGTIAAVVRLIQAHGVADSVIVSAYSLATLAPFVAAGITCMLNNDSFGTTPEQILAAGVTWMGASVYVNTDAQIQQAVAAGLKVMAYTVERHWAAQHYIGLGVSAILGGEPVYTRADPSRYRHATDTFATLTWDHGVLSNWTTRGALVAPDGLRMSGPGPSEPHILQGWACPVANPTTHTITATIKFDTMPATSAWGGIAFGCTSDRAFKTAGTQGYLILIRGSGAMELYKQTDGAAGVNLGTVATAAIVAGGSATLSIAVTATGITVTRTDGTPVAVSSGNTDYRGGYLGLCKQNSAVDVTFSDIAVS